VETEESLSRAHRPRGGPQSVVPERRPGHTRLRATVAPLSRDDLGTLALVL
jgi:hypothetical protein